VQRLVNSRLQALGTHKPVSRACHCEADDVDHEIGADSRGLWLGSSL
jgi:hypothetical protein